MDYWNEHADIAMNEAGLKGVTPEQLDIIAGVIESAHDFYGQNSGNDVASVNFVANEKRQQEDRIKQIERDAEIEKAEVEKMLKLSREERSNLEWRMHDLRQENQRLKQAS